jgi:diguanylate cyclase
MLSMDKMAVGGARFLARTSLALGLACVLVAAAQGFPVQPYTGFAEMLGALPLLVAYPMTVGFITYRLARRVRDQNRLLSEISRTDGLTRHTGAAGAEAIAERVRKRIESTTLTASGIRGTVSIGIAEVDAQDRDYSVWIAHADRALYSAKERGRNRVVRYAPAA